MADSRIINLFDDAVVGQVRDIGGTFFAADGVSELAMESVALEIVKPDGTLLEYDEGSLTNSSTGTYEIPVRLDQSGVWNVYMKGETSVPKLAGDAMRGRFTVRAKA